MVGDDRFSLSLGLSMDGAVEVGGEVGILILPDNEVTGESSQSVGASLGTKFATGFTWSAAWAKGSSMGGAALVPGEWMWANSNPASTSASPINFSDPFRPSLPEDASPEQKDEFDKALAKWMKDKAAAKKAAEDFTKEDPRWQLGTWERDVLGYKSADANAAQGMTRTVRSVRYRTADVAARPSTDPNYFQTTIGYILGNTHFGASWYRSNDFESTGSQGTSIGIGALHTLPKSGVDIYASAMRYTVEDAGAATPVDSDETVFVVGSRITF